MPWIRDTISGWAGRVALLGVACLPVSAAAQSGSTCGIPGFPAPILCARAGLDTLRASYIVVLDESGSMRPLWGSVREALASFIRAIPDGDEVDLRLFAGNGRRLNVPVPLSLPVRRDLIRQVEQLALPKGSHTDLGLAVEQVLTVIASSPPSRQHFIYILTDGAHDPAPGSEFNRDGSGRWLKLAQQAKALADARPLSIALLRLTADADAQGLVARSLPTADVVSVLSGGQLEAWLSREARSVALRKLTLRIAEERRGPAFVDSALSDIVVGGSSPAVRRSLRATLLARIKSPSTVVLEEDLTMTVSATPSGVDSTVRIEVHPLPGGWYLPPRGRSRTIHQIVRVELELGPREELERIGVPAGPLIDSVVVIATIGGVSVWRTLSYWGAVSLMLAGAFFGVQRAKWASHTARFMGQVRLTDASGRNEVIDLVKLSAGHYDWKMESGAIAAVLEARRERGQTALWVVPKTSGLTMNDRPLTKATRFRGTTRFECAGAVLNYFPTSTSEHAAL